VTSDDPWRDPESALLFGELPRASATWDLETTRRVLVAHGDPHRQAPVLHVGGTNGKGSVSAMLASVLGLSYRVGLYTSPHLIHLNERIQVDGTPVPFEHLRALARRIKPDVEQAGATFFEAVTAMAFLAFAEAQVEVLVAEVGLGGRLDATNVVDPVVSVVTNVGMDHAQYLGEDVTQIAAEKAGIFKPGVPAVTGANDARVLEVLRAHAAKVGVPLVEVGARDLQEVSLLPRRTRFRLETLWGPLDLETPLAGPHQAINAAVAVRTLEALPDALRPGADQVKRGLAEVYWPGRFQRFDLEGRPWVIDVAHNPAGIEALMHTATAVRLPRPWTVVVGILDDKDWHGMLSLLAHAADRLILTAPPTAPAARRWDPERARRALPADAAVVVVTEFDRALALAGAASGGTVMVTGSVHTAGDALKSLGMDPYGP